MGTLKPQSNRPLYNDTVIGTLAVDGWAVTRAVFVKFQLGGSEQTWTWVGSIHGLDWVGLDWVGSKISPFWWVGLGLFMHMVIFL